LSDAFFDILDLAFAAGVRQLDEAMAERGVSAETREQVGKLARLMFEFVPYALKQGRRPDDVTVFLEFAKARGLQQATLFGNDTVNFGVAVVGFLKTAHRIRGGFTTTTALGVAVTAPVAAALAFGLLLLDVLEIGNSCPVVQQAYYEEFLRKSHGDTLAARQIVEGRYGGMCHAIFAPLPATRPDPKAAPRLDRP